MSEQIPITRTQPANSIPMMPDVVRTAIMNGEAVSSKASLPKFDVQLPSQGHFYPATHPLSSGVIQLFEVTAKHEDILSNTALLKKGTVLDDFLKALIATPNVDMNDVLLGDKDAILLAARRSAYGDNYVVDTKCTSCDSDVKVTIDLGSIKVKPFDFSGLERGQNSFSFTLPSSGKTIVWKLLTHKDEGAIDSELKNLSKLQSTSPEVTTRLKYLIQSVDGNSDRAFVKKFVDVELSAKDSLAFRKHVRVSTPSIDMNYDFVCPKCGHEERRSVPMGANFFWPGLSEQ